MDAPDTSLPDGILSPLAASGENCWRVARADHSAVIIDAADYFRFARTAMLAAKQQILLIGWDFDARIEVEAGDGDDGPARIGDFLAWLVDCTPGLNIHLLRWDMGAVKSLGHVGTILGASRGTIAPTRRYYAGGGGSVRGFGFQQVGPMDAAGTPLGGNSIVEASAEARVRFTAFGNDLGLVPFVDAGSIATGTVPNFDRLKVGVGLGLRYYTGFGPVRIDIATPVNPGAHDPRVAFYVSIGQAF